MKAVDSVVSQQQQCPGNNVFPVSINDDNNKMVPKNDDDDVKQPNNNNNNESAVVVNGKASPPVLNGHGGVEPAMVIVNGHCGGGGSAVSTTTNAAAGGKRLVRSSLNIDLVTNGHYTGGKKSAEDVDDADENCSNNKNSLESLTDIDVGEQTVRSLNGSTPPENIPRVSNAGYDGLQVDSGLESAASSWDRTVAEVKEHAFARLQEELRKAHQELKLKDEEVTRLSRIRGEVEAELEDLTASLFQEAHSMVREANIRQAAAERALKESVMQVEVLTAEVAALKTLVLTSTPSRPNPHLHPQIDPRSKEDASNTGSGLFRKHRRSPSHFNLKYGRENSPPSSPIKDQRQNSAPAEIVETRDGLEVDPVLHKEFISWKQNPTTDKSDPFIARIYREDIDMCLAFSNGQLADQVREAIESGSIFIEAVSDKAKTHFPKKCALLESARQCQYRMRFDESDVWYSISQICRNRITAVCDFLNYLRYIQRGLVKSSVHDIYWEIIRLRKEMVLARLGLALST